jgi:hypothetical protein
LQKLANELPDAFTNYKGVTKSFIPAWNAPERMVVPNKTTQLPLNSKRGRSTAYQIDSNASKKRQVVKANQLSVDRHRVDCNDTQPSSVVHIAETGTSEDPRHISSGNPDESMRVDEIAINYVKTGETFDRNSTIVDSYFAKKIVECLQRDPDPKTMAERMQCSD